MSAAPLIVAVDGPAGVGKSTAARLLAGRLGVPYLNTGAMYRAVALEVLDAGLDLDDRAAVERFAAAVDLRVEAAPEASGGLRILLRGRDPGDRLRSPEVSDATSRIATYPAVRERLVELQREAARRLGGVVEGRDIGTRVFPDAPFKFFLGARPEVRFERRYQELVRSGKAVSAEAMRAEMEERDRRDAGRAESPLVASADAIYLDTSDLEPAEVVSAMLARINAR
ncbi:MAG TPA: (d)CMP kinase [Thermoanaerobaculia bacterium]|nr:(d)CMP kinase [Thermoanaerobaculia bacterium]